MKFSAIIVTYNPNLNIFKLINVLKLQGITSIVVDNASKDFDFKGVENDQNCYLVRLENNLGIATAQNKGIEKAIELGAEQILFFDQDSSIPEDYIENLYADYELLMRNNIDIGAIGPRFIDDRYNFYYKTISVTRNGFRIKHDVSNIDKPLHSTLLISSGSMISINTLKKVGLMRDNYFIDYVDTEWCLRAESLGYKNFISAKAVMRHTIGDNVINLKFFNVPVHSAFRRYYRVRNAFYMMREPHVPIILAIREIFFSFIHQIILISFERNKSGYLKSYFKGLRDGIAKRETAND
ncbi:rhamnosyltransferase family protein [Acinetobacter baumannii]|uniref:Gtr156 n=1 Tax=Acinetobacter baumannii TaxID=470 RepID=V5RBF6_ACIBA|nr:MULTISPECIES: glycosyltransferase family 2 protein [Acinetobacter calcoaceticus/baumannii complex]AHB32412.1 Gtr156 [Acinetobacter baumannii]KMV07142.1 rhamnosyltransferase family protein [Acinetobacter baumannii]MDC5183788.1 glycosyltransferase family 2 protein [Acinetobacter baumannii]MDC5427929.1 glycosyltransferase family 2 protein [Acinetobacter baumannii]MDM9637950.1 glycosyltransferase family 2 protein [Acinetobacter nosocomialis]